ncbi:MAG: TVP38/TMEM64 family protein [Planctomycetia bacterium]|nr:TVP38/TMEM64 family protein [Planctomycetia bacterium]
MSKRAAAPNATASGALWKKLALVAVVGFAVLLAYTRFGDALTLANLAQQESQLRAFQRQHPVLVYGAAFLLYVVVTGLSLPGAAVLTLAYGWYFGLVRGVLVVSFASTAGATMAFLLSRFLFRDTIQRRFGDRLEKFDLALKREGPFYLFTLRLIPAVPFFVINAVMGLTPIPTRTFWWVSQLGMLAGTTVYVYAGASVPTLQTLADKGVNAVFTSRQLTQIVVAFTLLGVFPLAVRWLMKLVSGPKWQGPLQPAAQTDGTNNKITEGACS